MDIIFYHPTFDTQWWIDALGKSLPHARVRAWETGDNHPADYALVWHPPVGMLAGRDLKAVFALGAGVDSILSKLQTHPEMLKPSIPLFRPEDTGMGEQMQEYAVSRCCTGFGALTIIASNKMLRFGNHCLNITGKILLSAFWGLVYWAVKSHRVCEPGAFHCVVGVALVNPWSGVQSFAGSEELHAFLSQCRVLINLLPNTPETAGIINQQLLEKLPDGAYLLNLARGVHVVEDDLLAALDSGKVKSGDAGCF